MRAMSNIKVSNKFSDNVATPKMFGNCSKKLDMYIHRGGQGQPRAVEPMMMMMMMMMCIHKDIKNKYIRGMHVTFEVFLPVSMKTQFLCACMANSCPHFKGV